MILPKRRKRKRFVRIEFKSKPVALYYGHDFLFIRKPTNPSSRKFKPRQQKLVAERKKTKKNKKCGNGKRKIRFFLFVYRLALSGYDFSFDIRPVYISICFSIWFLLLQAQTVFLVWWINVTVVSFTQYGAEWSAEWLAWQFGFVWECQITSNT